MMSLTGKMIAPQSPSPAPVVPVGPLLLPDNLLDPAGTLGNIGASSSNWSYDLVLARDGPAGLAGCSPPIENICSTVLCSTESAYLSDKHESEDAEWSSDDTREVTHLDIESVLAE